MTDTETILIVDPYDRSGRALSDLLSMEGYRTRFVCNGEQALEAARLSIGVAIIEYSLNDLPGAALARHLELRQPSVRVAFTESWCRVSDGIYRYGKYPVFTKPVDTQRLLAWIAERT